MRREAMKGCPKCLAHCSGLAQGDKQATNQSNVLSTKPAAMLQEISAIMRREIIEHLPAIGLSGVSGVGKSSTTNAMFRTTLATGHTAACSKTFEQLDLALQMQGDQAKHQAVSLR
jgi:predicted GTPase